MKILAAILLTIFLGKGCSGEQKQDLANAVVVYEANTRGFYQKITVQNKKVTITRDRKGDDAKTNPISDADWKGLIAEFQEINLDDLENLKAPTEKRFYDGAAIGNLHVTYKDKTYATSGFDHGVPPAEIERIVNKILSLVKEE